MCIEIIRNYQRAYMKSTAQRKSTLLYSPPKVREIQVFDPTFKEQILLSPCFLRLSLSNLEERATTLKRAENCGVIKKNLTSTRAKSENRSKKCLYN